MKLKLWKSHSNCTAPFNPYNAFLIHNSTLLPKWRLKVKVYWIALCYKKREKSWCTDSLVKTWFCVLLLNMLIPHHKMTQIAYNRTGGPQFNTAIFRAQNFVLGRKQKRCWPSLAQHRFNAGIFKSHKTRVWYTVIITASNKAHFLSRQMPC